MSPASRRRLSVACIVDRRPRPPRGCRSPTSTATSSRPAGFADNAARRSRTSAVRAQISQRRHERARRPRTRRPCRSSPSSTRVFDSVLRSSAGGVASCARAAVETHNAVFSQTKGSVVIDLANLGVIALRVRSRRRTRGSRTSLSRPREIALKIADRSLTVRAVRAGEHRPRCWRSILPLRGDPPLRRRALHRPRPPPRRASTSAARCSLTGVLLFAAYLIVAHRPARADGRAASATSSPASGGVHARASSLWCALRRAGRGDRRRLGRVGHARDRARRACPRSSGTASPACPTATWKLVARRGRPDPRRRVRSSATRSARVRLVASIFGAGSSSPGRSRCCGCSSAPSPRSPTTSSVRALRRRLIPAVARGRRPRRRRRDRRRARRSTTARGPSRSSTRTPAATASSSSATGR